MNYTLKIGWLYPELMSTYGDRGNIIVLQKRCEWRGIDVTIAPIDFSTSNNELRTINFIFGGGAQDRQQGILIDDLQKNKGPVMKEMIDNGTPGLFVCGSPQLLGHYFINGAGEKLEGLGIFDMVSKYPGKDEPRCIGNLVASLNFQFSIFNFRKNTVVGFENHGGRTYLGKGVKPFARVIAGNGNNGEDQTEGAVYKNCIATYSHGPFLPKNPHVADWLIRKALEVKYKKAIPLEPLDDTLEWQAHESILKRFKIY
ncbi:TPA: cobalamin biosynthesis protein CobQ [Patescibacteria group bacterium]|nr:cobalamin biosynthesis protein CobQ [Patescibacteria group bacterium]